MAVGKDSILRAQKAGQVEAAAEKPEQGIQEQQDGVPAETAPAAAAEQTQAPKRKRAVKAEAGKKPAARKRTVKKTAAGAKKEPAAQKEAADNAKRPAGAVRLTDEMPYYLL